MPDCYFIEHTSYGCGDEATFHIRWNGMRMMVHLDQNPVPDAAESIFIKRYTDACLGGDEDIVDQIQDQILDAIVEAGEVAFDTLSPATQTRADLHSAIFPLQYSFRLVTVGGKLELRSEGTYLLKPYARPRLGFESALITSSLQSPEAQLDPPFELDVANSHATKHGTTAIQMVQNLIGPGYISHVSVNDVHMCAKVARYFDVASTQRELDCLARITAHAAQSSSRVNIPKLLGLIEIPNSGKVIGVLEELIPAHKGQGPSTLAKVEDMCAIARPRREAWAKQVQQTVGWLHGIGVVWGDGKADNVLIHPETDEAWLIDFGGGWTDGWVDQELAGTVEGDKQAVRRMLEFLQV
ncbi:hypothetical protein NLG97_g8034 [Lecanicillium saksenae]|uniref:Uncharacterized protein n=1 Tax=Lecanicillium saksenae TaxID=468837 RepID=A0ACC1QK62_9HYPO|nr:hypothetical protein NLG97_g8034 [Lecanicillium saksenae]